MPERQRDDRVVAVTHRSAGVDARVATHHLPTPASGLRLETEQFVIFRLVQTVGITLANVNRLASAAEEFFHNVWLAAAATERFIAEDELPIHHKRRFWNEEPFALAAKCTVLARVPLAR